MRAPVQGFNGGCHFVYPTSRRIGKARHNTVGMPAIGKIAIKNTWTKRWISAQETVMQLPLRFLRAASRQPSNRRSGSIISRNKKTSFIAKVSDPCRNRAAKARTGAIGLKRSILLHKRLDKMTAITSAAETINTYRISPRQIHFHRFIRCCTPISSFDLGFASLPSARRRGAQCAPAGSGL